MLGSDGFSGCTFWMNWLRSPRLKSAVQIVAVLTAISCCRVCGFMSFDVLRRAWGVRCERTPAGALRVGGCSVDRRLGDRRAEGRLEEVEVAALIGLQDVAAEHPAVAALVARRRR